MVQSRHSKGDPRGGQWTPGARADDIVGSDLRLGEQPDTSPRPDSQENAVIRLFGRQRTLPYTEENGWKAKGLLANPVTRMATPSSVALRCSREMGVELAAAVVQDMLNDGDIPNEGDYIRVASHGAVKEPFRILRKHYQDVDLWGEICRWHSASSRLSLVEAMADCRSRILTSEVGTLRAENDMWEKLYIHPMVDTFRHLDPIWPDLYAGRDGHLVQRLLRLAPPPEGVPLIDRLPINAHPDKRYHMDVAAYLRLGHYLLSCESGNDSMHREAYDLLDKVHSAHSTHYSVLADTLRVLHKAAGEDMKITRQEPGRSRPFNNVLQRMASPSASDATRSFARSTMQTLQRHYLPDHHGQASVVELVQGGWTTPYEPLRLGWIQNSDR